MIVLLTSLAVLGGGLALRRSRRRTHVTNSVGAGACCRSCAQDQAAGRMAIGTTCSPCGGHSHSHAVTDVAPPPFFVEAIDSTVAQLYRRGADVDEAALAVLESIYPTTPDGQRIPWAKLDGSAACLVDLAVRVRARTLLGYSREAFALASEADAQTADAWARRYGGD